MTKGLRSVRLDRQINNVALQNARAAGIPKEEYLAGLLQDHIDRWRGVVAAPDYVTTRFVMGEDTWDAARMIATYTGVTTSALLSQLVTEGAEQ